MFVNQSYMYMYFTVTPEFLCLFTKFVIFCQMYMYVKFLYKYF